MKKTDQRSAGMQPIIRRTTKLLAALAVGLACLPAQAWHNEGRRHHGEGRAVARYREVDLVSDLAGMAKLQDTNLVNAWGISSSPTSPFWVSANGTGLAVLYAVTNDPSGVEVVSKVSLEVTIPGEGNPTGQLFNNTTNFNGDAFIFASEDGTISGWRGSLGTSAEVLVRRDTAVYKGITMVAGANGPLLLAANFSEGKVDVYDGNASLVGQFSDPRAPAGYAPFNVQNLEGIVFVTFARRDPQSNDDVHGPGHGFIDIFLPRSGRFHRFATGSDAGGRLDAFDSPWGLAIAPASFRGHANQLLVGNFGSGTIMTFGPEGGFRGFLEGESGQPVVIEGLWGITLGNGGRGGSPNNLYFAAGPGDEGHGLFGSLEPVVQHEGNGNHDDDDDDDDDD